MAESSLWLPPSMRRNATIGADALVYFERVSDGRLIVPPVREAKAPVCRLPKPHPEDRNCLCGYIRKEATSVQELERVSKRFEEQKRKEFAQVDEVHQRRIAAKMSEIRARLHHRMQTTHSQFEKDFIRAALKSLERGEQSWGPRRIEGHFAIESTEAPRGK
jgi:hypothetical protein